MSADLCNFLPADNASLVTSSYSLLPADLRKGDNVCGALQKAGINPALPTFVLAECVLVYMEPAESAALVRCLGGLLSTAVFVLYEQASTLHLPVFHLESYVLWPGHLLSSLL